MQAYFPIFNEREYGLNMFLFPGGRPYPSVTFSPRSALCVDNGSLSDLVGPVGDLARS